MKPLPALLWQKGAIHLWQPLADALTAELLARGQLEEAAKYVKEKDIQKGTREEVSLKHFVHRFKASACRVAYVVLDPAETFTQTSTQIGAALADGRVAVLDVPCGSGGGLLGMLCAIASLRAAGLAPSLPLNISVLAADYCPLALAIHASMIQRMTGPLAEHGIRLTCTQKEWDVTKRLQTAALMRDFESLNPDAEDMLILEPVRHLSPCGLRF